MAIKFYNAYIALTSEIEGYYSNPSSLASYSESNDSESEENFYIDIKVEDHSPNDSDSEMDEDGDQDAQHPFGNRHPRPLRQGQRQPEHPLPEEQFAELSFSQLRPLRVPA